ncbi:hypothetical protein N7466_002052 [Penicillium verhagenii]|uniref:uncharacterized protein n=1 Tax=Penicillium verhagenii TaxID=1562060 RepID=UPI0025451ABC|nr:uncharacterized protein N7466_002052 [Penicillium verhagenii]KAJ5938918.1 hypothetical protein N7466_002052 [Penicillium verhagenii]
MAKSTPKDTLSAKAPRIKKTPVVKTPHKKGIATKNLLTQSNFDFLYACVELMGSVNYKAVGEKLGISYKAAQGRWYNLKAGMDREAALLESPGDQRLDEQKNEQKQKDEQKQEEEAEAMEETSDDV